MAKLGIFRPGQKDRQMTATQTGRDGDAKTTSQERDDE